MITTKKDAALIRALIARMKQGPAFYVDPSYNVSINDRRRIEDDVQARVTEWVRHAFIAELDGLLPEEEKVHNHVRQLKQR